MEQGSDGLRERLLARLPQPENLAAYREETASLLAKHEKAISWDKFLAVAVTWLGLVLWVTVNSSWAKVDTNGKIVLETFAGVMFFTGGIAGVRYNISRAKVDMLKEVKQVQLQILELASSLRKDGAQ